MNDKKRVQETWDELEYSIRAMNNRVWIRTHAVPQMTESGMLHLPPKKTSFYGERMASRMFVTGTVLAVTPKVGLGGIEVGQEMLFTRLEFARHCYMDDKSLVGWVRAEHLLGVIEDDDDFEQYDRTRRRFASTLPSLSPGGRPV